MSKIINITDKIDNEKPQIIFGNETFEVNNTIEAVLKYEEIMGEDNNSENMIKAVEISLGKDAVKKLNVTKMSIPNFKVLTIAILAAMQNVSYEDAEARFQG